MSSAGKNRLFPAYALVLGLIFLLLSGGIVWALKMSYYHSIEETFKTVISEIEEDIIDAHYIINNETKLAHIDDLASVEIYEFKQKKYVLVFQTNQKVSQKEEAFTQGLHLEKPENDHAVYAQYGKVFKVYPRQYYIHIQTRLYGFLTLKNEFFLFVIVLAVLFYLLALYLDRRSAEKMQLFIQNITNTVLNISKQNIYTRLDLPPEKNILYDLTQTVNNMLDKLEKTLNQTKRFNAKVSHELRTPLTIIRGEIEVTLLKERPVSEYRELLVSTLEEIDTLQSITDNMLLLTKLDFELLQVKKRHIRLDTLVYGVVHALQIQAKAKNIEIVYKSEQAMLYAEETLMAQAVKNLIHNAIKYSPEKTMVTVLLKKYPHKTVLAIEDHGYGIAEEEMRKIYKPFYQSEKESTKVEGEGLGLSIVYRVLEIHHAELDVISKLGTGSTFTIIFT